AHLPIAAGAAWSAQVRKSGQVSVCFFGDGTTNIGAFHEALNLAVVWKLPVVFVCENNQYMEYTPIRSVTAVEHPAADRASAYGLQSILVDGNDADVMYETAQQTISKAREGGGPSLVEALTYRHGGHSRADPAKYRPEAEVRWSISSVRTSAPLAACSRLRWDSSNDSGPTGCATHRSRNRPSSAPRWARR